MVDGAPLSRRERLRAETLDEIRRRAMEQIADGGIEALSLNAVAKAMGMSGPAIYRYFATRDALVAALVASAWEGLSAELTSAADRAPRASAERRLRLVGAAYRDWALREPGRYRLVFGRAPEAFPDPDVVVGTSSEAMASILALLGRAGVRGASPAPGLARRLRAWAADRFPELDPPPEVLLAGVVLWTRLHGVVNLELLGVLDTMGLDGGDLVDAEVGAVLGGG